MTILIQYQGIDKYRNITKLWSQAASSLGVELCPHQKGRSFTTISGSLLKASSRFQPSIRCLIPLHYFSVFSTEFQRKPQHGLHVVRYQWLESFDTILIARINTRSLAHKVGYGLSLVVLRGLSDDQKGRWSTKHQARNLEGEDND